MKGLPSFEVRPWEADVQQLTDLMKSGGDVSYVQYYTSRNHADFMAMEVSAMWAGLEANKPVVNGYSGAWPAGYQPKLLMQPGEMQKWLSAIRNAAGEVDRYHPKAARLSARVVGFVPGTIDLDDGRFRRRYVQIALMRCRRSWRLCSEISLAWRRPFDVGGVPLTFAVTLPSLTWPVTVNVVLPAADEHAGHALASDAAHSLRALPWRRLYCPPIAAFSRLPNEVIHRASTRASN